MSTFLDDLPIYNAKAAVVIKNLVVNGDSETAALLSSLKSTANDESLNNTVRLNALTALINRGELLNVGVPPFFPTAVSFRPTYVYTGLHNALDGLNTGNYYHLTSAEYLSLVALLDGGTAVTFENLTGLVSENPPLVDAFALKQDIIPTSTASKFYSWDKTWRDIDWSYIASKPTTLSGFGISSGDTLFDGKYIQQSSVLSSYVIGANTPITNSSTLVGAFGNLQAQINAFVASSGTISTVGINTPSGFFLTVGNSPLPSGGGYMSLSLVSQTQGTVFAAPAASNAAPSFRNLVATDLPVSGVTANTYGNNTQWPIISVDTYGRITNVSLQSAAGSGTVQSVEVTMPAEFTESGNPITVDGTIAFAWDNQTEGLVFASPADSTGVPGFRALSASDIPDLAISQITNLQDALNSITSLALPSGQIFIGNASSELVANEVTGVITLAADGVTSAVGGAFPLGGLTYIPQQTLLGRYTGGDDGPVEEVTLNPAHFTWNSSTGVVSLTSPAAPVITIPGQLFTYNASAPAGQAALPPPTEGQILIGFPTRPSPNQYGLIWVTPSGVIDTIGTDGTVSLLDNSIDYAKLKDSASANILLGVGSSAGAISALSATDATAILDSFGGTTKGLVPGGSSGNAALYLNGAGGWTNPSATGTPPGGSPNQIQYNNAGSFGGTPNMEYVSGYGIYTTASSFYLTDSASARTYSIGFSISAVTGDEVWAFPNASSTFVGTDVSQTLTYKTLSTGSKINIGATASQYDMWYSADSAGTIAAIAGNAANIGKYLKYSSIGPIWSDVPGGGSGGASVSYYLNGSVVQGTFGGVVDCREISSTPVFSGGTDFTINTNGYIKSFITDANVPNQLLIPAGNWNFETYFSASSVGGSPSFYIELYKYDVTTLTLTLIAKNDTNPEFITGGTNIDLYFTALAVEETILTATDRLVVRFYVNNSGRTITMHTEGAHLSQVITTFTTGISSLNGLTAATQLFANDSTGTAPAFVSSTATHTLNIPFASASSVTAGLISKTEYDTFNGKLANVLTTTGDIIYSSSGTTAARLGIGTLNQVLSVSAGGVPEWKTIAGGGDVVGPAGAVTNGNFAVFDTTGQIIKESVAASLSATGAAVFNSSVSVGVSGTTQGQLVLRNLSGFTTTLQSSDGSTGSAVYTFPLAQATSAGLVLTNDGAGNLSWTATGTGNVTLAGTNAFTGANSFASTVGFSNQVTINGNSAGGTFRLQSPSNSGFTQLVSGATPGVTRVYTFPDLGTAALTVAVSNVGQQFFGTQTFSGIVNINSNGTGARLRIQSTGAAGYTTLLTANTTDAEITLPLAATGTLALQNVGQTFSGNQSFQSGIVTIVGNGSGGSFRIQSPASSGFTRLLSSAGVGAAIDMTFPSTGGTIPILGLAQNWSQLQTFQAGLTVSAGAATFSAGLTVSAGAATFSSSAASAATVTINPGVNSSLANPQLSITSSGGSNIQWMNFVGTGSAIPAAVGASGATRSAGTKIALSLAANATSLDSALGLDLNGMWLSSGNTAGTPLRISFYVQSSTNTAIASVGQFENSSSCYGLNIPVHGTSGIASLLFSGTSATHQYIRFNGTGFADPALTASRSVGTRIILSGAGLTTLYDGAIGVSSTTAGFWFSTTGNYSFWSNNNVASTANNVLNLSGTAVLNLPLTTGRLQINGTQVVGPRTGTYGTPTNPNRANTWDSSTITATDANLRLVAGSLAGLIADLKTHGLIG